MAVSCVPADLAKAAACFNGIPSGQREAIELYLLAVIAGGSLDPKTIAKAAVCWQGIPKNNQDSIRNYLLCQIVNS